MRVDLPPVLVLGDHLGYPDGVAHGVTTYFLQVLPALRSRGVQLTACYLREPHPAADELRAHGIEPIFLSAAKWDPFVIARASAIAREHGCRLVHAAGIKGSLVGRVVARRIGGRALVHVHDFNLPSIAVRMLHGAVARETDLALCVSRAVQRVAQEGYHIPLERTRVLHNGIRLDAVRNVPREARARVRTELSISAESRVIATIARLHPVKGHRSLLQMLPRIVGRCRDVMLILAGDGPERAACEALVDKLAMRAHVRFLGHRADVPQLLAAADLLAIPSQMEGLGLSAVEALTAGKPVVAFNVGGLGEVITDGVDGYLVEPQNQEAFVDAVLSLLEDATQLAAFGERARAGVERFSLDRHIDGLLDCYAEAARERSPT